MKFHDRAILAALFLALLGETPASAYLDPGSGSMVLQLVLAGVAGGLVALKLTWRRLLAIFGLGPASKHPPEAEPGTKSADKAPPAK
jgi:hypothetical protein